MFCLLFLRVFKRFFFNRVFCIVQSLFFCLIKICGQWLFVVSLYFFGHFLDDLASFG